MQSSISDPSANQATKRIPFQEMSPGPARHRWPFSNPSLLNALLTIY